MKHILSFFLMLMLAASLLSGGTSGTLPVMDGTNLRENYVGAHFANYDSFLVLSHFKGHAMAGFGGAIKNISIGIASSQGKSHIHSGGTGGNMWGGGQDAPSSTVWNPATAFIPWNTPRRLAWETAPTSLSISTVGKTWESTVKSNQRLRAKNALPGVHHSWWIPSAKGPDAQETTLET